MNINSCLLTMYPFRKDSLKIELIESESLKTEEKNTFIKTDNQSVVYSDCSYHFELAFDPYIEIKEIEVFVNDVLVPSYYQDGTIKFPGENSYEPNRIFNDCYGFVQISLRVLSTDDIIKNFVSANLPVLVKRNEFNDAIKKMVLFVYKSEDVNFINGNPKPKIFSDLKESKYSSLLAQIQLLQTIISEYEHSYTYFLVNARTCMLKKTIVEEIEKTPYITQSSVEYVMSHPEELQQVNSDVGIRIGRRVYQPTRIISSRNINCEDIYENQVVLSFIAFLISQTNNLIIKCKERLKEIPSMEEFNEEYVYSSFFMMSETFRMIENGIDVLTRLYAKLISIWHRYSKAFEDVKYVYFSKPRLTPLFKSVPQYNRIFKLIIKWMSYGMYDFEKENYMLSLINISSLYEVYLFARIIEYFRNNNFLLGAKMNKYYPVSNNALYKNLSSVNYVSFKKGGVEYSIFYQPVVFSSRKNLTNGIGLFRNNNIAVNTKYKEGSNYYVPDFLIKCKYENKPTRYLIIDAKFSDYNTILRYYVKDLAFKYLFSISTIDSEDSIIGCCVLYSKCMDDFKNKTAYDKNITDRRITPVFDLIPIMECSGLDIGKQIDTILNLFSIEAD